MKGSLESAHALRGDQEQLPLHVARTVSAQKSDNVCVKSFAILDTARLTAGKRRHHCSTKSWKRQDDWEVNSWLLENDNKDINLRLSCQVLGSSQVPWQQSLKPSLGCM